jgi:hypothetical protein
MKIVNGRPWFDHAALCPKTITKQSLIYNLKTDTKPTEQPRKKCLEFPFISFQIKSNNIGYFYRERYGTNIWIMLQW